MKQLVSSALLSSVCVACFSMSLQAQQQGQPQQPPPPPPAGEDRQGRPGGGAGRGPGGFDPQQFVDRLMAGDKDGDGKLSESEFPENLRERMFIAADANGDKFVDRDELLKYMQDHRPGGGPDGVMAAPGQQPSFHQAMEMAGGGLRGLRNTTFDAASQDRDLQSIQRVQSGLLAAKAQCMTEPMSAAAKAKFGTDEAAYHKDLRRTLIKAITEAITLESAVLDGKTDEAKASFARLRSIEEDGHDLFKPEE